MQTKWAELFCSLREVAPLLLLFFSHPSLLPAPTDPVAFFPVSLRVCYWWELRAAVFSKAACQQTLSSRQPRLHCWCCCCRRCRCFIPFRWPHLNPLHIMHNEERNAQEQTHSHTQKYTGGTAKYDWKASVWAVVGRGARLCVCFLNVSECYAFFSPHGRKEKWRWCEAMSACQMMLFDVLQLVAKR